MTMIKCQQSKSQTKNSQNKNHPWDAVVFVGGKGWSPAVVNVSAISK